MDFTVRSARLEDVALIEPWTADTFAWGDYVAGRIPRWLDDPNSQVIVCVDEHDAPLAVSHAVMLSPDEGWLEAARVHPEHKRIGMGNAMNDAGVAWTRQRGARVVRLAVEADNSAARRQVERLGYRNTSNWVFANFDLEADLAVDESLQFRPAPLSDVDAAWMAWSTSDLFHDGRGLIAHGWQWRKATPNDLVGAGKAGGFFHSPVGWVTAEIPKSDLMRTIWFTTSPEDAPTFLDAVRTLAKKQGLVELNLKTPSIPWMIETLKRAGGNPSEILVYSLTA